MMAEIRSNTTIFLEGPAKTGKTSSALEYLAKEFSNSSDEILVLVPQRTIGIPYSDLLDEYPQINLRISTITGLARNTVELFWPTIAEEAGFRFPHHPPTFLGLETAQYFMARIVRPLLAEDYFESVRIDRNRLYSQIIDNLNKAALNGYPYNLVGERLKLAASGDIEQVRIFEDAQVAANKFREYCLDHNLVDLSLQIDLFRNFLWPEGTPSREYLTNSFQHLIYDNLEEDPPIAHDFVREWLPNFDSALLIFDTDAGYRQFLGADPESGYSLRHDCEHHLVTQIEEPSIFELIANQMGKALKRKQVRSIPGKLSRKEILSVIDVESHEYFPEMLDWVAEEVSELISNGVPPSEIVILSPFLSDALRFSLTEKLNRLEVPWRSHRPSRSFNDEPVTEALVALASLAHPQWEFRPSKFDISYMLVQLIENLDLVRSQLLTEEIYQTKYGEFPLKPFEDISPAMQERITYSVGARYDHLRNWLLGYIDSGEEELDFFLSRIFGEVLAQPGYGFHTNLASGEITANLIDSIQNFRWLTESDVIQSDIPIGKEYIELLQEGLITGTYLRSWQIEEEAVLIAPAYTFLMRNRSVAYQFWLDIGSFGWHEIIDQPVTHPFVLKRDWDLNRYWRDDDEVNANQENLYRLTLGLMRRCTQKIYMGVSGLGETGYEYQGMLMTTLQRVLQIAGQEMQQ